MTMEADTWYPFLLEFFEDGGIAQVQLQWHLPGQTQYELVPSIHLSAHQVDLPGLSGNYYDYVGTTFIPHADPFGDGEFKFTRIDPSVDFHWAAGSPNTSLLGDDMFAVRWEGWVQSPVSGIVNFQVHSDDGTRLQIGNQNSEEWIICGDCYNYLAVAMEAGKWYPVLLEFFEDGGTAQIQFQWKLPGENNYVSVPQDYLLAPGDNCSLSSGPMIDPSINSTAFSLLLTNSNGVDDFYIYRSLIPYDASLLPLQQIQGTSFSDPTPVTNVENYFYYATEANGVVCQSVPSNQVGVFYFGIEGGE